MGNRLRIFSLCFGVIAYYLYHLDLSVPEEFYFKTDDFIRKFGFDCEKHDVETEDGFKLTAFRMMAPPSSPVPPPRPTPVLFLAGLFGSSDVMVMRGPDSDLPFILAEAGFDVWLGNYRGSRYADPGFKTNLSAQTTVNFGFEEIGVFDMSAKIDYILKTTGRSELDMVVVSAGSSSLIALQSLRPQFNSKIRRALHLGSGMALSLSKFYQKLWFHTCWRAPWLMTYSMVLEPFPLKPQMTLLFCERSPLARICKSLISQSIGYPEDQDDPRLSALLFTLLPSGNPLGVVDHIMQITTAETDFKMRDWGPRENLRRYNSTNPPAYDVTGITTYTKSYNTRDEALVTYELPRKIFAQMKNFAGEFMIDSPFDHVNFFINSARNQPFIDDVIKTLSDPRL